MSITVLLIQMIKLFAMICLGYILFKVDIIDDHTRGHMTKLVLYVTTPALIIHSFIVNMGNVGKDVLGKLFIVAFAMYIILIALSVIIVFVIGAGRCERGLYMFMTVFANVGFMGFPVVSSIYGTTGVFYTAIFNCVFNILIYTIGVFMMNYGQEDNVRLKEVISLKKLINPGVLCCFIAVVIFLSGIPVPAVADELIDDVGSLTSTLAMILVGASLATMNVRELFGEVRVYVYTVIKQIGIPLLLWPLIHLSIHDDLLAAVTLIMLSMPVANSAVLFATEYNRDEKLAGKSIFITTVASIATIPLVVAICL